MQLQDIPQMCLRLHSDRNRLPLGLVTAPERVAMRKKSSRWRGNRHTPRVFTRLGVFRPPRRVGSGMEPRRASPRRQRRAGGARADLHSSLSGRCVKQEKVRSRPISRVLSWTVIPLGAASPRRSSSLPGRDTGRVMASLFGLAPDGVCRAGPLLDSRCALAAPFHPCLCLPRTEGHRRSALCCTFRRLAPPRRYLASCPVEPGLSSMHTRCTATVWPTPQRVV